MTFTAGMWAGEWKVSNVVVCFGNGTCQVVDVSSGSATLIDQISDSSAVTNPGNTRGITINNALHLLVTDDGGPNNITNTTGANLVVYQIAGVDPNGNPVTHGVSTVFDGAGGTGAAGIRAVALDNAGNMYSLNANGSSPNIIEISPAGSLVGSPISLQTQCGISQVASMDLSSQGASAYVTSQGKIENVLVSGALTCSLFANLGSGVTFYGIKDIPASAQPVGCSAGTPCPHETVLVVASGSFESDGDSRLDRDDVNICTNTIGQPAVSCALLLDTSGPGLTAPPWQANHRYSVGQTVLDQSLHVQVVVVAGKSGSSEPAWNDTAGSTVDNKVTWQDQGTSVLARYPVSGQTTLQALSLDPLLAPPGNQICSNGSCWAKGRKISNFWMADSASGNFFQLDFATGTPVPFSVTIPPCAGCHGIESIGLYGGEGSDQPGLVTLGSTSLTGPGTTNTGQLTFSPDGSDTNFLLVTGYNFVNGTPLTIAGYASAINAASGTSDTLVTPTPPPNNPLLAPPAVCSPTTMPPGGIASQCVVWELDNNLLTQPASCSTNPDSCAFLGVQLEYPGSAGNPNFNVIAAIDEQYDVTDSVDTITHYLNSQISLHNAATGAPGATCTYQPPLSPNFTSPPACMTNTRNNIPFKFQCTGLPSGATQANLLPFLHIVQSVTQNNVTTEEPLLVLNGTGGTTNYRFDSTGQQWVFNLNNPGLGNYLACTEDATHTVPDFCTFFNVQSSCP